MKKPQKIVRGQRVTNVKLALAKQLRREMTPQEATFWARVRKNGVEGLHFRRQQIVNGFVFDFYCHQAALVVEMDGPIHLRQAAYDAERSRWLEARGLRVIRITNAEIDADPEMVIARVAAACRQQLASND